MKTLLLLGATLLSLCAFGQIARAGGDDYDRSYERPAEPRYYEGHVVQRRCYVPPPVVYITPPPVVYAYPRPYYGRRHYYRRPCGYGYGYGGYGYGPGVRIGVGF